MSIRSIRMTVLLSGLIAVAPALGCGGEQAGTSAPAGATPRTVTIEGANRFPDTGLRDWASFADHVAVFTVSSDREVMTATAEELAAGEYLIGREATLTIDQRLWSAPNAPELPPTIAMDVKGWAVKDGQRMAMVAEGEPRLEVGQRYLAPLLLMDDRSPAEWWPLTVGSMLQLESDTVRPALPHAQGSARQLAGRSSRDVADMVVREPPDPIARRFRHLRPAERVQKVLEALATERPPE
jgi:hypothetical protein